MQNIFYRKKKNDYVISLSFDCLFLWSGGWRALFSHFLLCPSAAPLAVNKNNTLMHSGRGKNCAWVNWAGRLPGGKYIMTGWACVGRCFSRSYCNTGVPVPGEGKTVWADNAQCSANSAAASPGPGNSMNYSHVFLSHSRRLPCPPAAGTLAAHPHSDCLSIYVSGS